ncbi:hypothetical protein AB0H12_20730 [Actinosynnema sp. NPDC023794]
MHGSVDRSQGRRPSRVPITMAVACAILLGCFALVAAISSLGVDEDRVTTFGVVLRVVLAVEGACCLVGAVLLARRQPSGRTLTAAAGAGALAFTLAMFPLGIVAPAELATAIRQAGGLVVPLVLIVLGLLTMVQSLRRATRDTITLHRADPITHHAPRW